MWNMLEGSHLSARMVRPLPHFALLSTDSAVSGSDIGLSNELSSASLRPGCSVLVARKGAALAVFAPAAAHRGPWQGVYKPADLQRRLDAKRGRGDVAHASPREFNRQFLLGGQVHRRCHSLQGEGPYNYYPMKTPG